MLRPSLRRRLLWLAVDVSLVLLLAAAAWLLVWVVLF